MNSVEFYTDDSELLERVDKLFCVVCICRNQKDTQRLQTKYIIYDPMDKENIRYMLGKIDTDIHRMRGHN